MNLIYDRVVQELEGNKKLREKGDIISLPWTSMPKLSTRLPGVQQGRYIIVTANSKVGKTQIADYLFLYEPLNYIFDNPSCNLKLKIFYFSLEMSKEDKILQMISLKIYKDTQKVVSTDNLRSYFSGYTLEDDLMKLIVSYKDYFSRVETIVTFIDNTRNAYGIYKTVRDHAITNGKFFQNSGKEVNPSEEYYDYYTPNDPNERVIVITDHISLLQPEKIDGKTQSLFETMFNFSSNYCLKMRDNFKYTVVNVQQQSADSEKQQFNMFGGKTIIDKIRPSADGLGDCKLTGRDCDLMLGLFAPHRYKIPIYPEREGYDISRLKDNYRELTIIFNRRGGGSINVDLYFNGAVNYFKELPTTNLMTPEIYDRLINA